VKLDVFLFGVFSIIVYISSLQTNLFDFIRQNDLSELVLLGFFQLSCFNCAKRHLSLKWFMSLLIGVICERAVIYTTNIGQPMQ